MAGRVAVDTSFLIDLQRERSRNDTDGPARRFLEQDLDRILHLPAAALGEFAEGFPDSEDATLRAARELYVLLPVDEATALRYGELAREMRRAGTLIGTNNLWIAAASLRHELPLATADLRPFARIPGLETIPYRAG